MDGGRLQGDALVTWLITPPRMPRLPRLGQVSFSSPVGAAADKMKMPKSLLVALIGAGVIVIGGPGGAGPLVLGLGAALVIEAAFGALVMHAHRRGGIWRTFAVRRAMSMTVLGLALMGAALAAGTGAHPAPATGASTSAAPAAASPGVPFTAFHAGP
jgi:hypothetical protein